MKKFSILSFRAILFFSMIFIMASCVSQKKHKSALSEAERLKNQLAECNTVKQKNTELQSQLSSTKAELDALRAIVDRNDKIISNLLTSINTELAGYDASDVKVVIRDGKAYITFSNKLLYQSGSPKIDDKGTIAIKKLSEIIKKNPDVDILIEGHTDNVPINTRDFKDNWELSAERASNVVRSLVRMGVKPAKLTAAGRGEFQPVATNTTEVGRQQNRRTEVIISPNLNELYDLLKKSN